MSAIRPLERSDLPQVTDLYEHVARSGARKAPPGLRAYFEETFLDYPGADPEIPSLVYVDGDGRIAGFLGSSVRKLVFDGRKIRLGISGQLVTEPDVRTKAAGAFLMKEYMNGPQDLTLTDTASDTVRRIWEGLGGETSQLACVGWFRLFRPWRFAGELFSRRRGRNELPRAARPVSAALDAASTAVARRALRAPEPEGASEELTPKALAEHVRAVASSFRLRPDYGEDGFAAWLLHALAAVKTRGELVARLVRGADGNVRGWYVYYLRPGGIAQVIQLAGNEREIGDTIDHLFRDARSRGASGVQGRVEAHLRDALSQRRSVFHASGYLALLHSRDAELLHAIQSGRALLTRLEGEWWMGHHLEPFGGTWRGAP
jgi:hypothetical protein